MPRKKNRTNRQIGALLRLVQRYRIWNDTTLKEFKSLWNSVGHLLDENQKEFLHNFVKAHPNKYFQEVSKIME